MGYAWRVMDRPRSHHRRSPFVSWARWSAIAVVASALVVAASACEDATVPTISFEAGVIELPDSGGTTVTPPSDSGAPDTAAPQVDADVDSGVDSGAPPACDDGKVDQGEICDPLSSCPTSCAANGCQLRTLQNPGTCNAQCVDGAMQVACVNGDGCCPAGGACNATNDDDCKAVCGNGVVEGAETCDPLGSCPSSCAPIGCQLRTLQGGGTCQAKCVNDKLQTACINADGCCPAGCDANNDSDCKPGCGNGVLEAGETCDPLASCPQACPQNKCQLQTLQNAGTCQAKCVDSGLQGSCVNNDSCCPPGCNANNDNDCKPKCDNGVVESGEACDPLTSCPTKCPQVACQLYTLTGAGTCQAACTPSGNQTKCIDGDGCCPAGCNSLNDNDCKPVCNNGILEKGETCDPIAKCPKCGTEQYTCYQSTGSAATCDILCHQPITKCGAKGDNCCPFNAATNGCDSTTDDECNGGGWKWMQWPTAVDTTKGCVNITINKIVAGGSYDITTCSPPGGGGTGTGDPVITAVVDEKGNQYAVANDNCTDPTALPNLAGSTCTNKANALTMACASPSPGGFRAQPGITAFRVTICPAPSAAGGTAGTTPLYIWFNATQQPSN